VVFSDVAARRLLLAVLPARRLPMMLRLECFDPRPMLSVSAAVAPLNPVPEAVPSAFCCELPWGTPRNDCCCFESASTPLSVAGSRVDDDRAGTTVFEGPTWSC
jgi:hypothetical protein